MANNAIRVWRLLAKPSVVIKKPPRKNPKPLRLFFDPVSRSDGSDKQSFMQSVPE